MCCPWLQAENTVATISGNISSFSCWSYYSKPQTFNEFCSHFAFTFFAFFLSFVRVWSCSNFWGAFVRLMMFHNDFGSAIPGPHFPFLCKLKKAIQTELFDNKDLKDSKSIVEHFYALLCLLLILRNLKKITQPRGPCFFLLKTRASKR